MVPSTNSTVPPAPRERRQHHRLGFRCPVHWDQGEDTGATRSGYSRDVSESGAGFITRSLSAPRIGDRIRVVFELDGENNWLVDERAHVVRCDSISDNLCNVGIELRSLGID